MPIPITNPPMPPHRPDDLRGWLTFSAALPAPYCDLEDSRAEADFRLRTRTRPATETERTLLEHLGFDLTGIPDLTTHVRFITGTLRQRLWPQLTEQTTTIFSTNTLKDIA